MINKIIEKAITEHNLSKNEIIELLSANKTEQKEVFLAADNVRKKYKGNEVHLRALIEFSNICKQNCLYCGLRRDNNNIKRYRLTCEQIIEYAKNAVNLGYKTIVLQSGEDSYFDTNKMTHIISEIKKLDVALTLSIGEKSFEEYLTYKNAGADRYLIRIETTDKKLYKKNDPDMSFENRLECLKNLKKIGYEVGSGCLVGLPDQTIDSLAEDILFFKRINADMIGIGPFIPSKDTPLHNAKQGDFYLALKVMAIVRLLMPDINIPATTAMETIHPDGRIIALQSGANVIMPNVTQDEYKKYYEIYPKKGQINNEPDKYRDYISAKIQSIGRVVSENKGFRKDN